jgi:site-specific DNA-cytosine methylase
MPKVGNKTLPPRKPTAAGCYIFAGGFTVGVRKYFDVGLHLEGSNYGVSTARKNLKGLDVIVGPENWPVDRLAGVDFLYGNSPCAAWSVNNPNAGKAGGTGWKTDPRVSCTREFFGLMLKTRPKVWAWESVCFAPVRGKAFVDDLTRQALAAGYSVTQLFHDAQYLGVPQVRKRWFLVCHRVEFTPEPVRFDRVITAGECLADVTPTYEPARDSSGHKMFDEWLPKVRQGQRLRHFWDEVICPPGKQVKKDNGHVLGRCGHGHCRLREDRPSVGTVGYAMVHPTEDRFLHINEVAALAGFPPSFDFGHTTHGARELDLIARGVCPPVGEWLAKGVAASIKRDVPVKNPKVVVYDFRVPGVTPVEVTADYKETA